MAVSVIRLCAIGWRVLWLESSEAVRLRALLELIGDQRGQTQEVMRGVAEDEQPGDVGQTSELDLSQRGGLLESAEGLLHQPSFT